MIRSQPLLRQTKTFLARFMSAYPSNPAGSELLMSCIMRRWLYNNDRRKCALVRQLDFDVEALGGIAAKACGASECNEIEVIGEGRSDFVPETIVLNPFQVHFNRIITML